MLKPYFDSILLYCLIKEFQSIIGEKVKGIEKDEENNLYLILSHDVLFASTHPSFYRTSLLRDIEKGGLRKHPFEDYLKYYNVLEIRQLGLDRIFYIGFSKGGSDAQYYLLFELIGPSSNIFLLDSNKKIILQHKKTKRKITGQKYAIGKLGDLSAEKTFQDIIDAESPLSALEKHSKKLPHWLWEIKDIKDREEIKKSFSRLIKNAKPYIYYEDDQPFFISPIKITGKTKRKRSFSFSVCELYDYLIREEQKERIRRKIVKEIKNKEKTFAKLQVDLKKAKLSEEFKMMGELILVNLRKIKKGEKLLKLKDPYDKNRTIEIEMDPSKSPTQNAKEYFKKYRKAKKSKKIVEVRVSAINKDIKNLKELRDKVDNLNDEELMVLEERLNIRKIVKVKTEGKKEEFKRFLTKGGKTVLVGRNKYENERLTFGFAKPKDLFFHIREAPGSHTILVNDGKLSKEDIIEAAEIAAYFSKAKHSTIVPVSYTERRYVRRSKKLGPGKVILTKEKTIFVEPRIAVGSRE